MTIMEPKGTDQESITKAANSIESWYKQGGAVINTSTLIDWARKKVGSAHLSVVKLEAYADPEGLHLASIMMLHNDNHWRVRVMIRSKETEEPDEVIIDVSMEDWERARNGTASSIAQLRTEAAKA